MLNPVLRARCFGLLVMGLSFCGLAIADPPSEQPVQFYVKLKASAPVQSVFGLRRLNALQATQHQGLGRPASVQPILFVPPPTSGEDLRTDWKPEMLQRSRWASLSYAAASDPEAIRQQLLASGLFDQVGRVDGLDMEALAAINEPLNTCGTGTGCTNEDPSRYQWWTSKVDLGGALDFGNGRALLGLVDSGLSVCHPDLAPALRYPLIGRRLTDTNTQPVAAGACPAPGNPLTDTILDNDFTGVLGELRGRAGHGMHVAGLMIGARNDLGGIGSCPGCGLAFQRIPLQAGGTRVSPATEDVINSGPTAINFSIANSGDPSRTKEDKDALAGAWTDSIKRALGYDMVVVAAIGNSNLTSITPLVDAFPATLSGVLSVGASDVLNERWHEMTINSRANPFRNAGIVYEDTVNPFNPATVKGRCVSLINPSKPECGSNYAAGYPSLYAPGAQVLSTINRIYIGLGSCSVTDPTNCSPDGNSVHQAPARNNYGNSTSGTVSPLNSSYDAYGTVTGTSMSAPIVTGVVGMVRSANPLVPRQAVIDLLQSTGSTGPASLNGVKLVNANQAVLKTLGKVRGAVVPSRLIPMFSLCKRENLSATTCVANNQNWIYTTSPQVAKLAIDRSLFSATDVGEDFGVPATSNAAYFPASAIGIGKPLTKLVGGAPTPWYVFPDIDPNSTSTSRAASASFYILSGPVAGEAVKPLWHLTTNCTTGVRRHRYGFQPQATLEINTGSGNGCAETDVFQKVSLFVLEGYVYSNPGPGRVALYRTNGSGLDDQRLILATELSHPAYTGNGVNAAFPDGYVIPAVTYASNVPTLDDTDGDGLVNGIEMAIGTNELTPQSDCDGGNDLDEYPMAGAQASTADPMASSVSCADLRLKMDYSSSPNKITVRLQNPLGPSTTASVPVNLTFTQPGIPVGTFPAGCAKTSPSGVLSYITFTCTEPGLAVGAETAWEFNFDLALPPPSGTASGQISTVAHTDPVPGNNSAFY